MQGSLVLTPQSSSANAKSSHYFSDFRQWQHVSELLFTANALAILLSIASVRELADLSFLNIFHHMLFATWVATWFAICIDYIQKKFNNFSRISILLTSYFLFLVIVWLSTCLINFLNFSFDHTETVLTLDAIMHNSFRHLLLGGGLGFIGLRYLYIREQWIEQQRAELMARVQALQARIHPHFLFNSLNSVVSLIAVDPFKAEQMLIDLSSLFRASLTELKEVSLEEEIELCRRYLKIESVRLGERLEVDWRLDKENKLKRAKIPLLTLQPLLENSIYHGVETLSKNSTVSILIEIVDTNVNIVLTNPYQPESDRTRKGNGLAIDNVKQRLIAYYGNDVKFNTFMRDGNYTTLLSYKYQ